MFCVHLWKSVGQETTPADVADLHRFCFPIIIRMYLCKSVKSVGLKKPRPDKPKICRIPKLFPEISCRYENKVVTLRCRF